MSLAANVVAAVQAVAADIKALYILANAALPKSGGTVTGSITAKGTVTGTGAHAAVKATNGGGTDQTSIFLYQAGAATDAKTWEILAGATSAKFSIRSINDAYSAAQDCLQLIRETSYKVASMQLMPTYGRVLVGTTTDNGADKLQVNGTVNINTPWAASVLTLGAAAAPLYAVNTGGGPYQGVFSTISGGVTYTAKFGVDPTNTFSIQTNGAFSYLFDGAGNFTANSIYAVGSSLNSYRFGGTASCVLGYAGGTSSSPTAAAAGVVVGSVNGRGYDGSSYQNVAVIKMLTDSATTSTSSAGSLTFSTTPPGSVSVTEAMRITSGQRILAGTTTDNGTDRLQVSGSMSASGKASIGGPLAVGSYTLTTLPSASAYSGYYITVSNATGGPKLCYSNGTNWLLANTTTTVS